MIDFRYRKLLAIQALLLTVWGIFLYRLFHVTLKTGHITSFWTSYWFYWLIFITSNILFLKYFALPSKKILEAVRTAHSAEDMTWSMIEETLRQKDQDYSALKTHYEIENLKYRTLLDSLLDPVFIYDDTLSINYANQAFQNLFNFSLDQRPLPLIEITRNLEFKEILRSAQRQDKPAKFTNFTFNQLQDPHKNFFEIKIFPMKNLSGHLCLMHDITQMRMADLMREDFVSNFSHEVRTPLTILNGQLQNLKSSLLPAEKNDKTLQTTFERIENNSRRLINLFNDLLRLTSVEKRIELHKEEINIEQMIETLCEELLINYPGKNISFNFDFQEQMLFADYNLIEQVLINLIDNALKYTKDKGTVTFRTFNENINDESWSVLEISDDGVGIPEDQVHRIFERFFRVDASRSSEIEGTGLGLAIVKHIIQKHEGKIKARSSTTSGTTFTILLPKKN